MFSYWFRHTLPLVFWLMLAYAGAHFLGGFWGFSWWQGDLLYLALVFVLSLLHVLWQVVRWKLPALLFAWRMRRYRKGFKFAKYPKDS